MRILAFDPGKKNFAFALLEDRGVVCHGHLPTITSMQVEAFQHDAPLFLAATEGLLAYRPDVVAIERMQHRPGFGGGAVSEYINVMIGMVLALASQHSIETKPTMSQTWKTHWIKAYEVPRDRFAMATQKLSIRQPKGAKPKTRTALVEGLLDGHDLTPHEGDAIGIAAYWWWRETGHDPLPDIRASW